MLDCAFGEALSAEGRRGLQRPSPWGHHKGKRLSLLRNRTASGVLTFPAAARISRGERNLKTAESTEVRCIHSPIVPTPCSSLRPGVHVPLGTKQTATLPHPKKQHPLVQSASPFPVHFSYKFVRRLPLLGVALSVCLALFACLFGFTVLLSHLLQQLSDVRVAELSGSLHTIRSNDFQLAPPSFPSETRFVTPTDPQQFGGESIAPFVFQSRRAEDSPEAFGAPRRRLENIVSIGRPDGDTGFDAQKMWVAFKGAPQDYLLFVWFIVNIFLAGCFCSWLCTQRSYQKAVMVSP
ncbi:hypothetical protein cyc_07175 [Cyclospora cayetanensis]|uniref:Transmembrane protein n=1 Tax=Cyclospora cayetanensis TaxID=88456 RepID=A0A1D3D8L2_9EIME|nr:hypothetical protein cyc_07175 [Cyclospora cayetanensis]